MSLTDIERRLARIEASRSTAPPTMILADTPIGDVAGDMRAAAALANWWQWVAQGKACVSNGVLFVVRPEMTQDEWAARHVTPD